MYIVLEYVHRLYTEPATCARGLSLGEALISSFQWWRHSRCMRTATCTAILSQRYSSRR